MKYTYQGSLRVLRDALQKHANAICTGASRDAMLAIIDAIDAAWHDEFPDANSDHIRAERDHALNSKNAALDALNQAREERGEARQARDVAEVALCQAQAEINELRGRLISTERLLCGKMQNVYAAGRREGIEAAVAKIERHAQPSHASACWGVAARLVRSLLSEPQEKECRACTAGHTNDEHVHSCLSEPEGNSLVLRLRQHADGIRTGECGTCDALLREAANALDDAKAREQQAVRNERERCIAECQRLAVAEDGIGNTIGGTWLHRAANELGNARLAWDREND